MTAGDWMFALLVTVAVVATLVCWLFAHFCYKDGWEAGRQYERNRASERRIRDRERLAAAPRRTEPWIMMTAPKHLDQRASLSPAAVPVPRLTASPRASTVLLTSTGEHRAVLAAGTDMYIDQMRAEEDAYRRELTA